MRCSEKMPLNSARKRVRSAFNVHFWTTDDKEKLVESLKYIWQVLSGRESVHGQSLTRLWVLCSMLLRRGFLSQPLTRLRIHISSLSFETVVWMISSRWVLELKCGKAGIPIFFSHQASTRRTLILMTAMPCLSVSDAALWFFWHSFRLPVLVAWARALGYFFLVCSYCICV